MVYMTNAMKPWFCYKQFIFVLNWTFLCNATEISTIANWRLYSLLKGALLSRSYQTLSCVVTQSAFSVCLHLPFDILPVMTMVNVTKTRVTTGIFGAAGTIHTVLVLFEHSIWEYCLSFFGLFFFTLWPLALVRISVSHARGSQGSAYEQSWIAWWTAWSSVWMLCPFY